MPLLLDTPISERWQLVEGRFETRALADCLYQTAVEQRLPVAVWRLPNSRQVQAVVDVSGQVRQVKLDLETLPPAFVFSRFHQPEQTSYVIPARVYWNGTRCFTQNGREDGRFLQAQRDFLRYLEARLRSDNHTCARRAGWFGQEQSSDIEHADRERYQSWVNDAVATISEGLLRKVVLARTVRLELRSGFSPVALFQHLCGQFRNAFVSLVAIPGVGTWIGATPELLFSLCGPQLEVVSLAGTQPARRGVRPVWGEKEREEQAFVSDYIRGTFLRHGITEFEVVGPDTLRIGKLLHLQTKFRYTVDESTGLRVVTRLLHALHPTPAVGGVPKTEALAYIRRVETFDREFYAGFLGPVNFNHATHLFVNLRCLQLQKDAAVLYAGAGITKDSVAEQEWQETELKLNALRAFLENGYRLKRTVQEAGAP